MQTKCYFLSAVPLVPLWPPGVRLQWGKAGVSGLQQVMDLMERLVITQQFFIATGPLLKINYASGQTFGDYLWLLCQAGEERGSPWSDWKRPFSKNKLLLRTLSNISTTWGPNRVPLGPFEDQVCICVSTYCSKVFFMLITANKRWSNTPCGLGMLNWTFTFGEIFFKVLSWISEKRTSCRKKELNKCMYTVYIRTSHPGWVNWQWVDSAAGSDRAKRSQQDWTSTWSSSSFFNYHTLPAAPRENVMVQHFLEMWWVSHRPLKGNHRERR